MKATSSDGSIRVAVLDANDLLREGLVTLLERTGDLICCGDWRDAASALRDLRQAGPDVLLVDMRLPGQSAFHVLETLPTICPSTRSIAMVDCRADECAVLNPRRFGERDLLRIGAEPFIAPDDCLQLALKIGAQGVLHNHCSFTYLVKAIRSVYNGRFWLEIPTANRLAEQYLLKLRSTDAAEGNSTGALTFRERQVAALVAEGRTNKEIAQQLHLGYSTVKNYVSSILEKLELRDRTQIALYALEQVEA